MAQGAVVEVDNAADFDAARVDAEFVAVLQVVVEYGCGEVVCQRDGVEVTGEVQVDVFHRQHLCVSAAGSTAFHAEDGAQGGFAQGKHGWVFASWDVPVFLLCQLVDAVGQADARGCFAFAGWGGAHGGDEDELAVLGTVTAPNNIRCGHFRFVVAEGNDVVSAEPHRLSN